MSLLAQRDRHTPSNVTLGSNGPNPIGLDGVGRIHETRRSLFVYKCPTCDKAFLRPRSLEVHMTAHSETDTNNVAHPRPSMTSNQPPQSAPSGLRRPHIWNPFRTIFLRPTPYRLFVTEPDATTTTNEDRNVTRLGRIRKKFFQRIRPVQLLDKIVNYRSGQQRLTDEQDREEPAITQQALPPFPLFASLPRDANPLHSPPVRTTDSNILAQSEANTSSHRSKTASSHTTARTRIPNTSLSDSAYGHSSQHPPSDTDTHSIFAPVNEAGGLTKEPTLSSFTSNLADQPSSTSSRSSSVKRITDNPSSCGSSSWNSRETNLTGHVRLHPSRKVYDGPYSAVYQGVYDDGCHREEVAIKVVKPVGPPDSTRRVWASTRRRRYREVTTGMNLHHPNLLPVYGVAEDEEFGPFGGIITPWCPNGNAAQYLHKNDLSPTARYHLWRGVVDGLAHLHSHNPQVVHGDMKTLNVLIADDGRPMICDLGLAQLVFDDSSPSSSLTGGDGERAWAGGINTTSAHTGTPRYLAPEQVHLKHPSTPTTATDVYAVGCIGFELVYSILPYAHQEHNNQGQIFDDIRRGIRPAQRPRIAMPEYHSSSTSAPNIFEGITILWNILDSCWDRDPLSRPSATLLREWLVKYEDVIVNALEW